MTVEITAGAVGAYATVSGTPKSLQQHLVGMWNIGQPRQRYMPHAGGRVRRHVNWRHSRQEQRRI